jgi:hypothetical protein
MAVAMIAVSAAGCGSTTTVRLMTTAKAQMTAVHIYAPFGSDGTPTVPISRTVTGECFAGSLSSGRSDAWRCTITNELQDPCFAAGHVARYVLCPEGGPWSGKVMRLNLPHGLPAGQNNSEPPPTTEPAWAVELSDGARCRLLTGTGNIVADLRENYDCTDSMVLYGDANHATQPWTIYGRHGVTGQLTPQPIAAMWY